MGLEDDVKTLRFEGHSDDTFGEYGVTMDDHDNCANGTPIAFLVSAGNDRLSVVGKYNGCWLIGTQLVMEGDALPSWPMRFEAEHDYSHALVIDVPDDATVKFAKGYRE
jgi:hypothetical protein